VKSSSGEPYHSFLINTHPSSRPSEQNKDQSPATGSQCSRCVDSRVRHDIRIWYFRRRERWISCHSPLNSGINRTNLAYRHIQEAQELDSWTQIQHIHDIALMMNVRSFTYSDTLTRVAVHTSLFFFILTFPCSFLWSVTAHASFQPALPKFRCNEE
jgi:hypothetical protein